MPRLQLALRRVAFATLLFAVTLATQVWTADPASAAPAASAAAAAAQSQPDALQPFDASYAWMWHGITVAITDLKLEQADGQWRYRSHSSPRGIGKVFSERPIMESLIRVAPGGVEPLSYHADDGTSSTKRDAQLSFDWEHGRVTGVYEDVPVDMPLKPGIQDDLSIQIALMVELLRGHAPQTFQLVDKNQVREYQYSRERTEKLATAIGEQDTIIYKAQKAGSSRITRFWCAPAQGFVPLRVEQKREDEVQWTMEIRSLQRHVLGSVTPN